MRVSLHYSGAGASRPEPSAWRQDECFSIGTRRAGHSTFFSASANGIFLMRIMSKKATIA